MAGKLQIKLVRGLAGKRDDQKRTVEALGLRKTGSTVEQPDTPSIRGAIAKVAHLLAVTEIAPAPAPKKAAAKRKAEVAE